MKNKCAFYVITFKLKVILNVMTYLKGKIICLELKQRLLLIIYTSINVLIQTPIYNNISSKLQFISLILSVVTRIFIVSLTGCGLHPLSEIFNLSVNLSQRNINNSLATRILRFTLYFLTHYFLHT